MRFQVADVVQGEGRRKESRAGHAPALIGAGRFRESEARPMEGAMLLSVTEVAARLGVARTTVFRLLRTGELPRLKIGAATRIDARDLEAYVDRLHGSPAPEPQAISAGQLRALHAMLGQLDQLGGEGRGASKAKALAEATSRFGRTIESASKLSSLEASEVLDSLEAQLLEARRAR